MQRRAFLKAAAAVAAAAVTGLPKLLRALPSGPLLSDLEGANVTVIAPISPINAAFVAAYRTNLEDLLAQTNSRFNRVLQEKL
jgi:hypothetical protein